VTTVKTLNWENPERVLELVAESLMETWTRATMKASVCGCHMCKQYDAELTEWMTEPTPEPMAAGAEDAVPMAA
jgi:hypothetical protein